VLFPGPTAARKGAYELRAAARELDLEVVLLGSELEGDGFWEGVRTRKPAPGAHPLEGVAAVVQPALVEDRPRMLLAALASGVPVIATDACGLPEAAGVERVDYGDAAALGRALQQFVGR
jgi:glycosyltransferase involved in cell wall biosynthesis